MKKLLWGAVVLAAAVVIAVLLMPSQTQAPTTGVVLGDTPANATYMIDGRSVTLVNGSASTSAAPDSATMITTMLFGAPVIGDLDGDGSPDAAVFLQEDPGGTGTFYYAAVAMNTGHGYQGSNAILLGDRIAPQTIEIKNNQLIANYADRAPTDPFSVQPSIGKSMYAVMHQGMLVDVTSQTGDQ